jgi:DNA-binding NarL/FixJ family response regulator
MSGEALAPTQRIRILLADDHTQVQKQLVARLKREPDFDLVGVALNSAETFQSVNSKKPDMLLMDPMMQDGLGLATLRQMCSQEPDIIVFVLTAFVDTALEIQLRDMGVRQVLVKGISFSRLLSVLRSAVK